MTGASGVLARFNSSLQESPSIQRPAIQLKRTDFPLGSETCKRLKLPLNVAHLGPVTPYAAAPAGADSGPYPIPYPAPATISAPRGSP
jgi:hypothetical protein